MSQGDHQPTGVEQAFEPQEIFFSTTDKRGVIDMVNSTFVRLSQYTPDELLGQPHSIVRHPQTPSALFHLIWSQLLNGKPVAAYVTNLAKDGSHARAMAFLAPLGDGFLSVRTAVSRDDLWEPIHQVYERTRALELNLQAEGTPKAAVAERGAQDLLVQLRALGYESYADVMRAIVPAEVQERRRRAPVKLPLTAHGESLFSVVRALMEVENEIAALTEHHDAAVEVAQVLSGAGEAIAVTLSELHEAAELAARLSQNAGAKVLATSAQAAVDLSTQVEEALQPLGSLLAKERYALLDLHLAITQTSLYADAAAAFAGEVYTGSAVGSPSHGLQLLGQAIGTSVQNLGVLQERAGVALTEVASEISRAQVIMADFQRALTNWRTMVLKFGASADMGQALSVVDSRMTTGLRDMGALSELAEQCRQLGQPMKLTPLARAAEDLVTAARAL